MRIIFCSMLLALGLLSCKGKSSKKQEEEKKDTVVQKIPEPVKENKDSILLSLTHEIILAFKNKDYAGVASFVHPDEGVRFSPYGYVDTVTDKVMTAVWIKAQGGSGKQQKILWGAIDNTGDPIRLTFNDYTDQFIYDLEFIKPEKVKVNEIMGRGNLVNNLTDVYTGCDFTESYFSNLEKDPNGYDWRSLRLVFKMKEGKYYLAGVIHDEWTT